MKKQRERNSSICIGWKAVQGNCVLFEGNDKVMASSVIQAEAYALVKGLMEANWPWINEIKILPNSAQLIYVILLLGSK